MYDNKIMLKSQEEDLACDAEILTDKSGSGRERPWRKYKMASEYLSTAYLEVNEKKSERLKACGKALVFDVDSQGQKKLVHMDSCRVRLCPLCSWRRSLKAYHNAMSIVQKISVDYPEMQYIFVTLTIQNCQAENLSGTLDLMFESLKRLMKRKEIQGVWQGIIRNMEVTHNLDRDSQWFDTYHPHFHLLVAVKPSYFKKHYISRQKLAQLWQECLRVDYLPQVDMRACYDATPHIVAEASKYAAKASDYLIMQDWDLTVETVATLDKALHKRRLIAYSGIMKQIKAQLKLEDVEDGSLVNVGENDSMWQDKETHKEIYWWYSGFMQYRKI